LSPVRQVLRMGRRIGIAIAGGAVVAAGVVMLVTPGPGILGIALGLGILSQEFERPRVWLDYMKRRFKDLSHQLKDRVKKKDEKP
jgi:uncharacterized protein (TIGR02611 family)